MGRFQRRKTHKNQYRGRCSHNCDANVPNIVPINNCRSGHVLGVNQGFWEQCLTPLSKIRICPNMSDFWCAIRTTSMAAISRVRNVRLAPILRRETRCAKERAEEGGGSTICSQNYLPRVMLPTGNCVSAGQRPFEFWERFRETNGFIMGTVNTHSGVLGTDFAIFQKDWLRIANILMRADSLFPKLFPKI